MILQRWILTRTGQGKTAFPETGKPVKAIFLSYRTQNERSLSRFLKALLR